MYKKILIPVDGSEPSSRAVAHGVALAEKFESEVTVLNVVQPVPAIEGFVQVDELIDTLNRYGRKIVAEYQQRFQTDRVRIDTAVAEGTEADVICDKARDENFDLIVIGSRGLSTGARILLGSVSGRVSRRCHCPVLIVR